MNDKSTNFNVIHQLPAGMILGDFSTELFACRETKKVFALSNGQTIEFEKLCQSKKASLFEMLLEDDIALEDLKNYSLETALEKFAFCVYGAADHEPDFDKEGNLMKGDNFMCSNHCSCLKWKSKQIKVDDHVLTERQIQVLNLLASDTPDKAIADDLGISESTLNTHKNHLFEKFGVQSKSGLITKAIELKIIQ